MIRSRLRNATNNTAVYIIVQVVHVARLEHLSDAVVHLESFVGTPMEHDAAFKAYNGMSSLTASLSFHQ